VLIDRGLSWAGVIVIATAGIPDNEAEELLFPGLKANRRVMRYVNHWVTGDADVPDSILMNSIVVGRKQWNRIHPI
jgi:hypothetical protein